MSASEWTFRLADNLGASWHAIYTSPGSLHADVETELEPLRTEGIDGELQRSRGAYPRPVVLRVAYPHATTDVSELDRILGAQKGTIVRITLRNKPGSAATVTQWNGVRMFLMDYAITGRGGKLHGYGAVSNSTRTTEAELTLQVVGTFGRQ